MNELAALLRSGDLAGFLVGLVVVLMATVAWMAKYIVSMHKDLRDDGKLQTATMVEVKDALEKIYIELREWRR